jgi:hypothetical protein
MADLNRLVNSGKSRTEIAQMYSVHKCTVAKWCQLYGILVPGAEPVVKDIICGQAIVIALLVKDGEPERFALPGGAVVGRDEALWAACAMSILMGGKDSQ